MEDYFHWLWLLLISYVVLVLLLKITVHVWWIPRKIEKHFMKQGIKGPKYQLFLGNLKELASLNMRASAQSMTLSHNILPRVLSFYHHWKKLYGSTFLVWFGSTPRLAVSDPSIIREIFLLKSDVFEKIEAPLLVRKLEGDGLLNLKGEKWSHHRKIMQPSFHTENLKMMIPMIAKSMEEAVTKWAEKLSNLSGKFEIEVSEWFDNLVEDVITRATFGNSYEEGRAIFRLQSQQMIHATEAYQKVFIPGFWLLPTKQNRISWRLDREIRESLHKLIDRRRSSTWSSCQKTASSESSECPSDLLEFMIMASLKERGLSDASSSPLTMTVNDVVEECKTIFFAGKHTTSNLLTWTTVLLAMHPHWQEQAREEVLRVCGARDTPNKDDLPKLKTLSMILNESLRLYPPIVAMLRRAKTDAEVGGIQIQRGTEILVPILAVHHDPTLWSQDVHEFNPTRFSKGVAHAAKHPMAFMPFGLGVRRCIGQNLAMLQAKLGIAMMLQRFSFELSPTYQHAPAVLMLLHPQHGAPIVFRKL